MWYSESLWGADVGQYMLGRPSRAQVPGDSFWPWLVRVVMRDMASVYTDLMEKYKK